MKPLNLVLGQPDPARAEALATALHDHVKSIAVCHNFGEVLGALPKHRADVLVIDLEMASLPQIDELRRDFRNLQIVCTHRLADEEMWTAALAAGAADCCHPSDVRSIVLAANGTKVMARTTAA